MVCHLTTVTEREALYTSQYFFDEGELVAICEGCLNFFKRSFFPSCFCFKWLRKCFIETFMIQKENLYIPAEFQQILTSDKKTFKEKDNN